MNEEKNNFSMEQESQDFSLEGESADVQSNLLQSNDQKLPELEEDVVETVISSEDPIPPKNHVKISKDKETTLGSFLQEARGKSGYSLHQVALLTRLNVHYIEAIERDDFDNTPPYTYVRAYVKKLCHLYNINSDEVLSLLKPFGDTDKFVSENVFQELEDTKQINIEQTQKLQFIAKIVGISAGILIISAIVLGVLMLEHGKGSKHHNKPVLSRENTQIAQEMQKLIVPESFPMTELSVPTKKKKHI